MKKLLFSFLAVIYAVCMLSSINVYGEETENTETEIQENAEENHEVIYKVFISEGTCEPKEANEGTEITVTGIEKPKYRFDGWYDNDSQLLSNDEKYVFIMPSHDVYLTGKYTFIQGWYDNKYYLEENNYVKDQWMTVDLPGKGSAQCYFDGNGNLLKGQWKDGHYLTKDGSMLINSWLTDNQKNYYLDQNGNKVTGVQKIDGKRYIFNGNGELKKGWVLSENQWYYANQDGIIQTGWKQIKGKWYYLKGDGSMATGWQKVNQTWYYLNGSGSMKTGWLENGGKWYFLNSSGAMVTGWSKLSNKWYYFESSGAMAAGWKKLSGKWYYLDPANGDMKTGWRKIKNTWYYMDSSGAMKTGWLKNGNQWYYLASSGAMKTGWQKINSIWYYLKDNGAMVTGDIQLGRINYHFNSNGAMDGLLQNSVPYYSQNDSRWANYRLGNYNAMRSTGCTPSVAASIVDYLKGTSYTPQDIAKLFYDWGDYNKDYGHGTASTCWRKFADHFSLKYQNNMSYQDIINALKDGKLCAAAMGNGYFAGPSYTHSICFFGIDAGNRTYVYDPLNSRNNGWYSVRDIYNQRASLWLDNLDGGPIYALSLK